MHQESATTILKLFGRPRIAFKPSTPEYLFGRISWNDDPEDVQEIAVDLTQPTLSADALMLAQFLHERELVRVDRVAVGRETLRDAFFSAGHADWTLHRFNLAYRSLLRFRLRTVGDDGELGDSFSLRE